MSNTQSDANAKCEEIARQMLCRAADKKRTTCDIPDSECVALVIWDYLEQNQTELDNLRKRIADRGFTVVAEARAEDEEDNNVHCLMVDGVTSKIRRIELRDILQLKETDAEQ